MRKTGFILCILCFLNAFGQTESEFRSRYPDCIQFSPLFLLEPYTHFVNLSIDHQVDPKMYIAVSVGFAFNESYLFGTDYPLEKGGVRLSFDVKQGLWRSEKTVQKRTRMFIGFEPYFKYLRTIEKHKFAESNLSYNDAFGSYYNKTNPPKEYEYECIRRQTGCIIKAVLKHTYKRFSFDFEFGGRAFYKVVTQGNVDLGLHYYNSNLHDMYSGFYCERFNSWTAMPFLNVKLGRLF